jgi:hypothetical protein
VSHHEQEKAVFLTVSEGKRLIARGVARHPLIEAVRSEGKIAVAKGTTNAYVVEELLGTPIHKPHYCTGTSQPRKARRADVANKLEDLVLEGGKRVEGLSATEAIDEMGPGDVFVKGANALNYLEGVAGVLIGHPTGGTVGAAIGRLVARRIQLVIPVGLEKEVPVRITEAAWALSQAGAGGKGPTLWPVHGEIVTEIDALEILTGVRAVPIGAGGINGGEGGVWLALWGTERQLAAADELIDAITGEPPFVAP